MTPDVRAGADVLRIMRGMWDADSVILRKSFLTALTWIAPLSGAKPSVAVRSAPSSVIRK